MLTGNRHFGSIGKKCIFVAVKRNIIMNKNILFLISILVSSLCPAIAQDIIVLRNADKIQAKVQTIGFDDITYKKWDF